MARFRGVALVGMGLLVLTLPACKSGAGRALPPGARAEPYSAYRPRYDVPPRRTLFLGGYAGFNYGPIGGGRRLPTRDGGEVWGVPVESGRGGSDFGGEEVGEFP